VIAKVPGARIWYEDSGSGAPLFLLHAGSGNSALWSHQMPAFAAAGHRCIAYDRRGHGKTEVDPRAEPVAASQDLNLVVQELGLDRIDLVGTAAGGIVAFDFALSHPHRVRSLVIANSIGGVQDEDYLALQRRLRPSPQFDNLPVELRELGPAYRAANEQGVRRWLELERAGAPKQPAARQPMANRITWAALAKLAMPVLLLTGDADLYAPPPVMELFRQRIPSAKSLVIPGCGHSAYWEQPELFNRAILDFLVKS
jgi:pimeloyl-ACP methyl ester carboxylesterase